MLKKESVTTNDAFQGKPFVSRFLTVVDISVCFLFVGEKLLGRTAYGLVLLVVVMLYLDVVHADADDEREIVAVTPGEFRAFLASDHLFRQIQRR